ncbi:MAG: thioredoxin family protein [Desulfobacteraceae bacterium]|nr:thioredoxin family protein [Desulfobacteraceae bacterium]
MEKEVLSQEQIIEYLNDNFISVRVDTEAEEKIASKYKVRGLPAVYFLKEDGSVLNYRRGYVDAKELMYMIKFVNTESYKQMSYQNFIEQN